MTTGRGNRGFYGSGGKRILDLAIAIPLLIAALPVMLLVALLVAATLGRPVLFRQRRPGLNGEPFVPFKFRTMMNLTDGDGRPRPDAERLTGVGRFLRATSLDELPELLNVFKGEMSLVGPRPLLMSYLERYSVDQARRHDVRPGITGWAQVNGRNALSWEQKFSLDLWYVDHLSLKLDLRILARTFGHVLLGRGIHAPGHATMPEFQGKRE